MRPITAILPQTPLPAEPRVGRKRSSTLGSGSYGRVNEEVLPDERVVATKYFLSEDTLAENISEVAILKYLKGIPNIAQFAGLADKNTHDRNLNFPAVMMAKAVSSLDNLCSFIHNNIESNEKKWDYLYNICLGVIRGFDRLHALGIVHRDIKPGNMLLTNEGEAAITDFGSARYITESIPAIEDGFVGTIPWASPELILQNLLKENRLSVTYTYTGLRANDAWSVGASLLYLITGRIIFWNGINSKEAILNTIFTELGLPKEDDGLVYELYNEALHAGISFMPTESEGIKNSLKSKLRSVPSAHTPKTGGAATKNSGVIYNYIKNNKHDFIDENSVRLQNLANIIQGLLKYDIKTRLSLAEARKTLDRISSIRVPPSISSKYTSINIDKTKIDKTKINEIFNKFWITAKTAEANTAVKSRYIILDRTFIYTIIVLDKIKNDSDLHVISSAAFIIATSLFNANGTINKPAVLNMCAKDCRDQTVKRYINYILKEDIPLIGKTLLDEMIAKSPTKMQELGFLNLVCLSKMLYNKYNNKIEKLQEKLIEIASTNKYMDGPLFWTHNYTTFSNQVNVFEEVINTAMMTAKGGRSKATRRKTRRQNAKSRRL
jgi:serine/threonine protein kinase